MHSTNYRNTLILPAQDCKSTAKIPDKPGSVADLTYQMCADAPYVLTSDDILCGVAATRKAVPKPDLPKFQDAFHSKGQPCFRASPLTKTHGWAVHSDADGRVALLDPDGDQFASLMGDENIKKLHAMRNKKA